MRGRPSPSTPTPTVPVASPRSPTASTRPGGGGPKPATCSTPARPTRSGGSSMADREREPLVLDAMLGKLATYLRMCGYDTAYALDRDAEADEALLALVETEGRRLVTRDEGIARQLPDAVLLTEREVGNQLRELLAAGFDLELAAEP